MLQCGRRPRDVKLRETCGELEAAGYFWGSDTESGGEKLVLSGGRDQISESLDLRSP